MREKGEENEEEESVPGSDPRLCVHLQAASPAAVLLRANRQETPLSCQLFSQGTNVIGFKPAAASDVTNASIERFPGVFLHVPSAQDPRLQTCLRYHMRLCVRLSPLCRANIWTQCLYIPKGNSGRSMNPWRLQSGVWYASGWHM